MKLCQLFFILISFHLFQVQADKKEKTSSPVNTIAEKKRKPSSSVKTATEKNRRPSSPVNTIKETADSFIPFLPEPLSSLKVGDPIEKIIPILGEPAKIDSEKNYFYELSGKKYDTTVGTANGKVSYIIYSPPAGSLTLQDLKPYISQETLQSAYQKAEQQSPTSHDSERGRYFEVQLRDESFSATVRRNNRESIDSITFLK